MFLNFLALSTVVAFVALLARYFYLRRLGRHMAAEQSQGKVPQDQGSNLRHWQQTMLTQALLRLFFGLTLITGIIAHSVNTKGTPASSGYLVLGGIVALVAISAWLGSLSVKR